MANIIKLILKRFNGTDFDTIHPETEVSQVVGLTQYIEDAMSNAGSGDMIKSVYDANNDGIVNHSDLSYSITGFDTRSVNSPPTEYMSSGTKYYGRASIQSEFKSITTMGLGGALSGTYCQVITMTPWSDASGGYPIQMAYGNGNPCWRVGTGATTWSNWTELNNIDGGTF